MDDSIGVTSMNRLQSVHFRSVTRPSHSRGMGVDAHARNALPTLKISRRFIDSHRRFCIKNKTLLCTDDVVYHVRHQYSATVYLKIKVCMEWVSEFEALYFNTLHDHNATVLPALHCTTTNPLHCTHYTALYSLHCTVLTTLHHTHYTALYSLHCTVLGTLHCTHYTSLCSLHCTNTTPLHCAHFAECSDPYLIKEAKILSRDINERVF